MRLEAIAIMFLAMNVSLLSRRPPGIPDVILKSRWCGLRITPLGDNLPHQLKRIFEIQTRPQRGFFLASLLLVVRPGAPFVASLLLGF